MESKKRFWIALLFILPFGLLYTVFTIWPVFQGMWISLWKWGLMGPQKFVGFDNGGHLLVGHDAEVQAHVLALLAASAQAD